MIPILHHNDRSSIYIQYFNRWKKRILFLFIRWSRYNRLKSKWWCHNNIRSIKIREINNFPFFDKKLDTNSEEIILIISFYLNLILILNFPLSLLMLRNKSFLNKIKNSPSISNIRCQNKTFSISKSFSLFAIFQCLKTFRLMLKHMIYNNLTKLLDCLLLLVLDMD